MTKSSPEYDAVAERGCTSILWRRLDAPGHESARVFHRGSFWHLTGTAVFADSSRPCRLDYLVVCDSRWETLSGRVAGWIGDDTVQIELFVDPGHVWRRNREESPGVAGCIDLDLAFSPSTNLIPIRRLGLAIGEEAEVRAAWLRFPDMTIEPLEQIYRRTGPVTYSYESDCGRFVREVCVNEEGFITTYPGLWQVEASI